MTPVHRKMTFGIYAAIKHNRKSNDIPGLQQDIMNSIDHVLGNHEKCRDYFCSDDKREKNDTIEFNVAKEAVCYDQIVSSLKRLCLNAKEQICKLNSNNPERFFSRINKNINGKRTHLSNRGSFERRSKMAAIQSSKGYSWHAPAMMQHGIKVSTITENFTRTRDEETSKHRNYRSKYPNRKKAPRRKPNIFYGNIQRVLSIEELKNETNLKLKALELLPDEIASIEKATRLSNAEISTHQKQRLHCDDMPNLLKHKDSKITFDTLIRKSINKTAQNLIINDDSFKEAKQIFERHFGTTLTPCGLFIEKFKNFFCCQPHGIAEHIEALFLYCGKVTNDFEQQNNGNVRPRQDGYLYHKVRLCFIFGFLGVKLDLNYNLFSQAQIEMFITGFEKCYIMFPNNSKYKIVLVRLEPSYWPKHEAAYTKIFMARLTETITNDILYQRTLNANKKQRKLIKAKKIKCFQKTPITV
jgi:hypothetical protein